MKLGMIMGCEAASFDKAKEIGLDFCEFDLNYPKYWGPRMDDIIPRTDEIREASSRTGIEVGAVGRWGSQVLDQNGDIIEDEFSEIRKQIDFAAAVGSPNYLCSVAYVPELSYYKNITAAIKVLNNIVELAGEKDIKVSIVNCMMGGNYIRTPEQWKLVLDEVPGLCIKYDPSHSFVHGGENGAYMKEAIEWGNRFGYVHIKGVVQTGDSEEPLSWNNFEICRKHPEYEGLDKVLHKDGFVHNNYDNPPAGLDAINWRGFFGALYKHNYDGYLGIEPHSPSWTGEKGDLGVLYTIKYIRSLMI